MTIRKRTTVDQRVTRKGTVTKTDTMTVRSVKRPNPIELVGHNPAPVVPRTGIFKKTRT